MNIPTHLTYPIQASTEQWTDGRVIEAIDLENLLMFVVYGQNVLSQSGMRLCGHSFRQRHQQTLLTVKVIEDGIPLVAFITANSTIGCMSRFLNLFEDDRLTWVKDKYPWS